MKHPIFDEPRLFLLGMLRRSSLDEVSALIVAASFAPPEKVDPSEILAQALAIDFAPEDVQCHVLHQNDILPPQFADLAGRSLIAGEPKCYAKA